MPRTCTRCKREKSIDSFCVGEFYKEGISRWCKECTSRQKEYRVLTKDKQKGYRIRYKSRVKEWVSNNRGRVNYSNRKYYANNKKSINSKKARYISERRKGDELFYVKDKARTFIRFVFGRKRTYRESQMEKWLMCDTESFRKYLLSTWKKNYGTEWNGEPYHIDHIIPLATAKTEEEVIRLCHYTNLQMLTPEDHEKKSIKERNGV